MLAKLQDLYYTLDPSNPHSVMLVWTSNAYSRINNILRNYSLSQIYTDAPNVFRFIKLVVEYFETNGVDKHQLRDNKHIKVLYRGITTDIAKLHAYNERGFMSTSWKRSVAERFAVSLNENGTLQCYATSELPSNMKMVIIDSTVASYLNEAEVLFMPGFIEIVGKANAKGACTKCKYTLDEKLVNYIKTTPMPKQKKMRGGAVAFDFEKMVRESMGMTLVYYRARYQQQVEIFDRLDIPTTWEAALDTVRFTKVRMEQYFSNINEFIPEFVALRKTMKSGSLSANDVRKHMKIMNGYEIYPALYDPKTNNVLTTHYLLPDDLFYDLFDKARDKDVIKAVQNECKTWNFHS